MDEANAIAAEERPLWRRVVDFPLVAMLIAVGLFILATSAAALIGKMLPAMPQLERSAIDAGLSIALVLGAYKSVIVRLGERPRDDLRAAGALKGVAAGMLIGFLLFCTLVGIAALLDVYNIVG